MISLLNSSISKKISRLPLFNNEKKKLKYLFQLLNPTFCFSNCIHNPFSKHFSSGTNRRSRNSLFSGPSLSATNESGETNEYHRQHSEEGQEAKNLPENNDPKL